MKTIAIFSISLLMTFSLAGQDLFVKLTDKYANQEGFSATNLTSDMFDLYLRKKQVESNSPVYETLKRLTNILVVNQTTLMTDKSAEKQDNKVTDIHQALLDYYRGQSYTLFKTENRMGEDLKVYLKKTGEKINALSLITASPTRVTLVELKGDIDLASVSELSKALNVRGLENLTRINGQSDFLGTWISGNDLNITYNWNEDQQKNMQLLMEKDKALKDIQLKEFTLQSKDMMEKQKQMEEKYREMAERYNRHPIMLSAPGDTNMIYIIDGKKANAKEVKNIDPDQIRTIEVIKPDKEKPGKKGEIRITTRK